MYFFLFLTNVLVGSDKVNAFSVGGDIICHGSGKTKDSTSHLSQLHKSKDVDSSQ